LERRALAKVLRWQWLKVALDGRRMVMRLKEAGHTLKDDASVVEAVFGQGMGTSWRTDSQSPKPISPSRRKKGRADRAENVFFVPAHRSLLISNGWASTFNARNVETPVVARVCRLF
jgi:hypothetical protein